MFRPAQGRDELLEHTLRKWRSNLARSYEIGFSASGTRLGGVVNFLRVLRADWLRRARSLRCEFETLTEADLCRHEVVQRIRVLPRLIVRCRRCGVAFATQRNTLDRAIELHDGDYFLANQDIVYQDGRPNVFSYTMPRTLFLWALGLEGLRSTGSRALDVGCGLGIMPRYLEYLGFEAHGVEISRDAVEYARRELGQTRIVAGTLESAAFPDAHFELVTLVHVLEHLDDPVPTLREIFRVLRPGGYLYVESPCSERDTSDYQNPEHFWFYGRDSLNYLLSCMGFRQVKVEEGTFDRRLHNVPFLFAAARRPLAASPGQEAPATAGQAG